MIKALRFIAYYGLMFIRRDASYSAGSMTNGYAGWSEVFGRLVAFRRDDGSLQFGW